MAIINHILACILAWVLLWNAYILLFNKGIPNIRTAPAIRFRIIGLLRQDAAARGKTPCVIVDLGSGNGLFRRQIARRRKLEYRNLDFNAIDLGDADAGTHNIGRAGSQRLK